jgi:hypothetical protein
VNVARRAYLYGIALVALGVLLTGLAGLLDLALSVGVERSIGGVAAVGRRDLRGDVSYSGALAASGLIVWLIHWWLADRAVRRPEGIAERASALRRLYLYAVLLVGGLILLFAMQAVVADLLRLAFGRLTAVQVVTGSLLSPLALALTCGALWLYHRRVAATDRAAAPEIGVGATLRRWFVYGVAFVALLLLLFGAAGLIRALWEALVPVGTATGPDPLPLEVADRLGAIVAGLVGWLAAWRWSNDWLVRDQADPEIRSTLRKVYLYAVLAIAVTWTVWDAGQILYGLLRVTLLGIGPAGGSNGLLRGLAEPTAAALVFGVAWLYHARVVRHEAALAGEAGRQLTIRLLYEYLVGVVALGAFATGVGGTLDTLLDLLFQPGALRPTNWWEDRISLFATLVAVGLPLWLLYWRRLDREAAAAPAARGSVVRRVYLLVAFAGSVLALLFGGAFALYQLIRLLLGESWSAAQTSDMVHAASVSAVAALLLAYHLSVLRRDAAAAPAPPPEVQPGEVRATAVVRARDGAAYDAFRRMLAAQPVAGVEVELRVDPPEPR